MSYTIRPLVAEDEPLLWEMLYHAAHMAEDGVTSADAAKTHPFLAKYVQGWGGAGDLGVAAIESVGGRALGVAWVRHFTGAEKNYSVVDETVPELAIAVLPGYTDQGIGTQLLMRLLDAARSLYSAIVLSVRADNPARRLYERVGFVAVDEITNRVGGTSLVMKVDLLR